MSDRQRMNDSRRARLDPLYNYSESPDDHDIETWQLK